MEDTLPPREALARLVEGNGRFCAGERASRNHRAEVVASRDGQRPFAMIVGCIDSRVPPELVFDQGIGDLMSIRVAGNAISPDVVASLELGYEATGARLIVVMGHTGCAAIAETCEGRGSGAVAELLSRIRLAMDTTQEPKDPSERNSENADFVMAVTRRNIALAVSAIGRESETLARLRDSGEVAVVGALYDIATGAVEPCA